MIALRIKRATQRLAPPTGVEDDCNSLSIRAERMDIGGGTICTVMWSAWEPTPAELTALNEGRPVMLGVVGQVHPMVMMGVADHESQEQA